MAGSAQNDEDGEITGINVTPLVDVMLVLLVIFMVTATYIVNQSIKVSLPKSSSSDETPATNLAFVLDKESKLSLDGKPLLVAEIASIVQAKREGGKALQALIAADKETPHGAVIGLIDAVRQAGIFEFAINIEKE